MEFLFVSLIVTFAAAAVWHGNKLAEERREIFDRFAGRCGGLLTSGSGWLSGLPVVKVGYRGLDAEVRQTSTGGKHPVHYIECSLGLAGLNRRDLRLEIYPEQFLSSLGKLMGMQDLLIHVPDFDNRYILKCNDHALLQNLCDQETRDAVDTLYYLFENRDIYLHVDRAKVLVKKRKLVQAEGEVDAVFQGALPLFDAVLEVLEAGSLLSATPGVPAVRFLADSHAAPGRTSSRRTGVTAHSTGSSSAGIQFLSEAPKAEPTTVCPVCGEELAGRVNVACSQCDGRHHHDCWMYSGSCTTYGCSSTRYTEA